MAAFHHGKIKTAQVANASNTGSAFLASTLETEGWARVTLVQVTLGGTSDTSTLKGTLQLATRDGNEVSYTGYRQNTTIVLPIELISIKDRLAQFEPGGPSGTQDFIVLWTNDSPLPGTGNVNYDVVTILGD